MPHANENTMPAARAPKLLDQLRDAIRTKHYSLRTEQAYVQWVRRYIHFHGLRHPSELGKEHVEAFLTSLAVERHVAASTQTQALSALLFLYKEILRLDLPWLTDVTRAKKPVRLPTVLTRDETQRLLGGIDDPLVGLIVRLLYGSGMRLLECLRLRVKDVDFERGETVQELLGHSDVKTTMIDAHVLNRGPMGVVSPLDRLPVR